MDHATLEDCKQFIKNGNHPAAHQVLQDHLSHVERIGEGARELERLTRLVSVSIVSAEQNEDWEAVSEAIDRAIRARDELHKLLGALVEEEQELE